MVKMPRYVSAGWLLAVFLVVVYRAKTQSLTIDEAFAFDLYVDSGITSFFTGYDAANHVLHTFLTWIARRLLGTSELVLRLPSLLGACAYLLVVHRLTRLAAGNSWLRVAGVVGLTSNPLVLDFLTASRGYGLGLALFSWSLYYALRWLGEERSPHLLYRGGITAGLAIGANLTLVVPVVALCASGFFLVIWNRRSGAWTLLEQFVGPAITVAFVIVALPLAKAEPSHFYLGTKSLSEASAVLWDYSFLAVAPGRALPVMLDGVCGSCVSSHRDAVLLTLVFAAGGAGLFNARRLQTSTRRDYAWIAGAISGIALLTSVLILMGLNRLGGVPYPFGRTGLYLIPMLVFALMATAASVQRAMVPGIFLLSLLSGGFLSQFTTTYFIDWRFDASTNHLLDRITADRARLGRQGKFQVGGSWIHEMSLKYYRKRRKLHDMEPVIAVRELLATGPDYYVLHADDRTLVRSLKLRVVYEDPLSGSMVAAKT